MNFDPDSSVDFFGDTHRSMEEYDRNTPKSKAYYRKVKIAICFAGFCVVNVMIGAVLLTNYLERREKREQQHYKAIEL